MKHLIIKLKSIEIKLLCNYSTIGCSRESKINYVRGDADVTDTDFSLFAVFSFSEVQFP